MCRFDHHLRRLSARADHCGELEGVVHDAVHTESLAISAETHDHDRRRWKSIPTYCRSIGASSSCEAVLPFEAPSLVPRTRNLHRSGGPAPSSHQIGRARLAVSIGLRRVRERGRSAPSGTGNRLGPATATQSRGTPCRAREASSGQPRLRRLLRVPPSRGRSRSS